MNSKFYVSLEVARLLKEKGCPINGRITKAEAIDWLESKGIVIAISLTYNRKWFCTIESLERGEIVSTLDLSTRLEAEEAAIIKALELL